MEKLGTPILEERGNCHEQCSSANGDGPASKPLGLGVLPATLLKRLRVLLIGRFCGALSRSAFALVNRSQVIVTAAWIAVYMALQVFI